MADGASYESWVNSETEIDGQLIGSSWDICQLGEVMLPGVITIEDFEIGRDVDVQKRRKKEKARLRDNGLSQSTFNIVCELRGRQWHEWLKVRPYIQPKEGGVRTPLAIVHPLPNSHDVRDIYVHKIQFSRASARNGLKITIRVGEWFEEEKDVKATSKTTNPPSNLPKQSPPNYFGDPKKLARDLAINHQGLPMEDAEEAQRRMFDQ